MCQAVLSSENSWNVFKGNMKEFLELDRSQTIGIGRQLSRMTLLESPRYDSIPQYHLIFTGHHATYDDWGLVIFMNHLEAEYFSRGVRPPHFSRFVKYCLESRNDECCRNFWSSKLSICSPAIFPAPPMEAHSILAKGSMTHFSPMIYPMNFENLATTASVAWAILSSRYTSADEVVFGLVHSGRQAPIPDLQVLGGPTVATFPFVLSIPRSESLQRVWTIADQFRRDVVPHEQYGLHNIRRLSQHIKSLSQFQCIMVLQPKRTGKYSLFHDVTRDFVMENNETFGMHPITLVVEPDDSSISVEAVFDEDIISSTQMQRILQQFSHLMRLINQEVAVPNGTARISDLYSLCEPDIEKPVSWNTLNSFSIPGSTCAHSLFDRTAHELPKAAALSAWDGQLTYERLNVLANNFAAYLSNETSIGPESVIPLYFDKSKWTAVAILGVMKTGAAFTLLDPSLPELRLRTICEEVKAPFILSYICNPDSMVDLGFKTITFDESLASDRPRVERIVSPKNVLYVTFTSGSTGKPKGIVIEHDAFCNSVNEYIRVSGLGPGTKALQHASHAFDVAVTDYLATLIGGGCVCIPSPKSDLISLSDEISRFEVNHADLTPSVLQTLKPCEVPTLKTLVVGGETMSKKDIDTWADRVRILNIYGPAECCVLATMQQSVTRLSDPSNIGFPAGGTCWIVDQQDHDKLMPIGAIGELLIGGPIVGRGYHNMSEKSAESFISAPTWHYKLTGKFGRLYKTGDLAQYQADGSLRFCGRKDMQIKLRGQRVELSEVEYCLSQVIDAKQIVVDVIRPQTKNSPATLTAFVSRDGENQSDKESNDLFVRPHETLLKEFEGAKERLSTMLPKYLIPNIFLALSRLPQTVTGKVNRKILIEEASNLSEADLWAFTGASDAQNKSPLSAEEQFLHDIVCQETGMVLANVGKHDNLSSLGLDSISTMQIVGQLKKHGWELQVSEIFANPTLSKLSQVVRSRNHKQRDPAPEQLSMIESDTTKSTLLIDAAEQCKIDEKLIEDIYPCSGYQEILMGLSLSDPKTPWVLDYKLKFPFGVDISQLQEAWRKTARANTILRSRIFQSGSRAMQAVLYDDPCWIFTDDDLETYWGKNHHRDVHWGDRLIHLVVNPTSKNRTNSMLMYVHHAICDGYSVHVLLKHLESAYSGVELQANPFARFIDHILQTDADKGKAFWETFFSGLESVPFPQLPHPDYKPLVNDLFKKEINISSTKKSAHSILSMARLAYAIVVSKVTRLNDVIFHFVSSGRGSGRFNDMVGFTTSSILVGVRLGDGSETTDHKMSEIQADMASTIPFEQMTPGKVDEISAGAEAAGVAQTVLNLVPPTFRSRMDMIRFERDSAFEDNEIPEYNTSLLVYGFVNEAWNGIQFSLLFDSHVITRRRVEWLLQEMENVMEQIWKSNQIRLSEIEVKPEN